MKIYVITKGCYSSYHICAVATDPGQAKKLAKVYTDRYDHAEVEEFDTADNIDLLSGRVPYYIIFSPAGNIWHGPECEADSRSFEPGVRLYGSGLLGVGVYAPDAEAAKKIASDMRAKYLAQKAGL